MNFRHILAIARKDARDIIATPSTLISLLIPLLLMAVYLLLSQMMKADEVTRILVYNPGKSQIVQSLQLTYKHLEVTEAKTVDEVIAAFGTDGSKKESPYFFGLAIGEQFDTTLSQQKAAELRLFFNEKYVDKHEQNTIRNTLTTAAYTTLNPQPLRFQSIAINQKGENDFQVQDMGSMWVALSLVLSLMTGLGIMSNLLIEEKEKKTIRILLVSPASYLDLILGKLFVAFFYQIILSLVGLLIITSLDFGMIVNLLPFVFLGAFFSTILGTLLGSIFATGSAAGAVNGVLVMFFLFPAMMAGPLQMIIGENVFMQVIKALPTYYLAHGIYQAILQRGTFQDLLLDYTVIIGTIVVLTALAIWALRRQAGKLAAL